MKRVREKIPSIIVADLTAWTIYGAISFASSYPYIGLATHLGSVRALLINRVGFVVTAALVTVALTSYFRKWRQRHFALGQLAAWVAVASYLAGATTAAAANGTQQLLTDHPLHPWSLLFS